jgi:hypothetical protein
VGVGLLVEMGLWTLTGEVVVERDGAGLEGASALEFVVTETVGNVLLDRGADPSVGLPEHATTSVVADPNRTATTLRHERLLGHASKVRELFVEGIEYVVLDVQSVSVKAD